MTDVSFPNRGYSVRFLPLRYFAEIAAFAILLLITIRLPGIGKFMTLGWLGMLGLLLLSHRIVVAKTVLGWWPVLLGPILAVLSFFWSDVPSVSGRYGLQLLLTAFTGVLLARTLSPSRFLTVLFLAMLTFCILSLVSGRSSMGVLIGLVGSKNQMSFLAYVLAFASIGVMFDKNAPKPIRLLTLPGFLVGTFLVATTASATAYIVTFGSIGMFAGLWILHKLRPAGRVGVILAMVLVASPILLILPEINLAINDFLLNVLHKDPGLTGRDYLWNKADELIAARPLLGYGFQAFWLGDSTDAQVLLARYGQTDGRVFNFHHTYRQFAVDTGLIGMGVLIVTVVAALFAYARRYVMEPTATMTFFFAFYVLSVGRTLTEVLLVPFSAQTLLLFVCIAYAFWRPLPGWEDERQAVAPPEPDYPYPIPQGSPYPVSLQRVRLPADPAVRQQPFS